MRNSAEAGMAFVPSHEPSPTGKPMTGTELSARIGEIEAQRSNGFLPSVERRTGRFQRKPYDCFFFTGTHTSKIVF